MTKYLHHRCDFGPYENAQCSCGESPFVFAWQVITADDDVACAEAKPDDSFELPHRNYIFDSFITDGVRLDYTS